MVGEGRDIPLTVDVIPSGRTQVQPIVGGLGQCRHGSALTANLRPNRLAWFQQFDPTLFAVPETEFQLFEDSVPRTVGQL